MESGHYAAKISKFVKSIIKETKDDGLEEIILNIEPLPVEGFRDVVKARDEANAENGTNVAIQFRVFQETYNKDLYVEKHANPNIERIEEETEQEYTESVKKNPSATRRLRESDGDFEKRRQEAIAKMPKANYENRYNAQARALEAGFDNVGLGVLFNLNDDPVEEIQALIDHVELLREKYGKSVARICLPSANELKAFKVDIGNMLEPGQKRPNADGEKLEELKEMGDYEKFDEMLYVMVRMALPDINIVSSERDTPGMLAILDKYATCTTLGVETADGANAGISKEEMAPPALLYAQEIWDAVQKEKGVAEVKQATTFPRKNMETMIRMILDGWEPKLEGKAGLIERIKKEVLTASDKRAYEEQVREINQLKHK